MKVNTKHTYAQRMMAWLLAASLLFVLGIKAVHFHETSESCASHCQHEAVDTPAHSHADCDLCHFVFFASTQVEYYPLTAFVQITDVTYQSVLLSETYIYTPYTSLRAPPAC